MRVIPLNPGPDPKMFKEKLIKNGRLALRWHGRQLVEYEGSAMKQVGDGWIKFNVGFITCEAARENNY